MKKGSSGPFLHVWREFLEDGWLDEGAGSLLPGRFFHSGSGSRSLKLYFLQKTGEYAILNKKEMRYGICC